MNRRGTLNKTHHRSNLGSLARAETTKTFFRPKSGSKIDAIFLGSLVRKSPPRPIPVN